MGKFFEPVKQENLINEIFSLTFQKNLHHRKPDIHFEKNPGDSNYIDIYKKSSNIPLILDKLYSFRVDSNGFLICEPKKHSRKLLDLFSQQVLKDCLLYYNDQAFDQLYFDVWGDLLFDFNKFDFYEKYYIDGSLSNPNQRRINIYEKSLYDDHVYQVDKEPKLAFSFKVQRGYFVCQEPNNASCLMKMFSLRPCIKNEIKKIHPNAFDNLEALISTIPSFS